MFADDPRSTEIHCGSLKRDDHRVVVLPSTALLDGKVALSVDEALVSLPCESRLPLAGLAVAVAVAVVPPARCLMAKSSDELSVIVSCEASQNMMPARPRLLVRSTLFRMVGMPL